MATTTALKFPKLGQAGLPYVQDGQPLGLTGAAGVGGVPQIQPGQIASVPATGVQPNALNQQVLEAAQQKVLAGTQSPTMDLTSQRTQELLRQPYALTPEQAQQQRQAQLEQYDVNQAKSLEAMRQQFAPVIGSGEIRGDLLNVALEGATERSALQREIEGQQAEARRSQLFGALGEGRATSETEAKRYATDIGALVDVRGAAEGEETRTAAAAESAIDRGMQIALSNQNADLQGYLTDLKGKIDEGLLLKAQDFEASMSELDRALEKATSEGNWQNALQIENLRGEIEKQMQTAQQSWQTGERVATQGWSTTERISTQDFDRATQYIGQEHEAAMQNNDFEQARYLAEKNELLQLKMQVNDMDHDTSMRYLDAQIADAKANNDVEREKLLMDFQATQEMRVMADKYGYDEALMRVDAQLQDVRAANDWEREGYLLQAKLSFEMEENALDRQLEQLKINMQQQGIQMDTIMAQVEQGLIEPDAAIAQVMSMVSPEVAAQIRPVDPWEATSRALDIEYQNSLRQFLQTHPEYYDAASPNGLSQAGHQAYNEFFNSTVYQSASATAQNIVDGIVSDSILRGAATLGSPQNAQYTNLLNTTAEWESAVTTDSRGVWNPDVMKFANAPAAGEVFRIGNRLYRSTSALSEESKGQNYQYFTAMDIDTGQSITISANQPRSWKGLVIDQ